MTDNSTNNEQFMGLILLTGVDSPGIASSLFECLAPFAVHIVDIEQVVINSRLILTVLIVANPAHQGAIEDDLAACATALDVDIATLFSNSTPVPVPQGATLVSVTSSKLHPREVAQITSALSALGCNIKRFVRVATDPVSIDMTVSGSGPVEIKTALTSISLSDSTTILISGVD
jgi:phosphoserine phosphatase